MPAETFDLYEGREPRDVRAYSFREVALCIGVPVSTLRAWCLGQRDFAPVLSRPGGGGAYRSLSFFNLIEANVIAELRRDHQVSMNRVRKALAFLAENVPVAHPLVEKEILITPKQRVYIVHKGKRTDISAGGQWPLDAVVRNLLRRVHRGSHGILTFYPRVVQPKGHRIPEEDYAPVVVDPEVCFGRPLIAGTAIPTDVVADRYRGGESVRKMAEDYNLSRAQIEAALRFERAVETDAA